MDQAAATLRVLHYISPVATAVYFASAKGIAACLLHEPHKHGEGRYRRFIATALLLVVVAIFAVQGIYLVTLSYQSPPAGAPQDQAVYTILGVCTFGALGLGLLENKRTLWHPYLGAAVVGALFEIPVLILGHILALRAGKNSHPWVLVVLSYCRVLVLLSFCACEAIHLLRDQKSFGFDTDGESRPLLAGNRQKDDGCPSQDHRLLSDNGYGSTTDQGNHTAERPVENDDDEDLDSDGDEPEDKALKAEQRRRLKESGNWLNYLKDFRVFIPMLWPSHNRPVQLCIVLVIMTLIAERFLAVLVPRQLGIVTDALTESWGSGQVPWRAVGIWMLLAWLNSRAGLDLIRSIAQVSIQQFAFKGIAVNSFEHIMNLSMDFHSSKNSGELIRAIEQGQNLQGLLEFAFFDVAPMFIDLIVAFVYVYTLFDIYMSLTLLLVGIVYVWIGIKTTAWTINQRRRLNNSWRAESKVQNEAINNWQTVSHFNRSRYESKRYATTVDDFNAAEWSYYMLYYVGGTLSTAVMLSGRLIVTGLAAYRIAQGKAPIGHFVTLISYWSSIESPLSLVSFSVRRVTSMLTDSERLLQLMQTKSSIIEKPGAPALVITAGEVEFDGVSFSYDARKPLIKEVSFKAKSGQTIALVGETGGGKSTLLKLLYRYYDVKAGSVRVDGQDVRDVSLDSLRDSFGMVPQDPALFNISVMENIKYARLDATDEEVKDACRAAAIHDQIMSFPDGYYSKVGERGVKLSGGELQRVAIARAILRRPKLVLLDEATSSVDATTEERIQEAFKRLTQGRTTFVVAHRLSTIQHADQILVINQGQIVERGTHDELLRLNGKYVELWSKQVSKHRQDASETLGD